MSCRKAGTVAGMSSVSPRPNDRGGTQPPVESQTCVIPHSWSGKCTPSTPLRELGGALTMMKEDKQGHGVTVPPKLRQFLANLAAILAGQYDARRATKKQIQQLGGAIIDHGRMVSQFYSHQPVGVEVNELAFRFRETNHNVVTALVLLEKEGRA